MDLREIDSLAGSLTGSVGSKVGPSRKDFLTFDPHPHLGQMSGQVLGHPFLGPGRIGQVGCVPTTPGIRTMSVRSQQTRSCSCLVSYRISR